MTYPLTIAVSALAGAACVWFGMQIGDGRSVGPVTSPDATAPADQTSSGPDVAEELQRVVVAIARLERSVDDLKQAHASTAAPAPPPTNSSHPVNATPARLPPPQGPIASELDAQRLSALPRTAVNTTAVDRCLEAWSTERGLLIYLTIEDIVARFGFPTRADAHDAWIMWRYEASAPREGRAGAFVLKIAGSRVLDAVAMP